jgi:predicted membrane protein DUF2232
VVRLLGLLAALALAALETPPPWAWLWLAVPGAVAAALLVTWRFGTAGALVPLAVTIVVAVAAPRTLWAWWVPAAAVTGAWMGAREEGGGPAAGQRAWMLSPLLLVAVLLPQSAAFQAAETRWLRRVHEQNTSALQLDRQFGCTPGELQQLESGAQTWERALPAVLPTLLLLWMAALVSAGRAAAAALARLVRWPPLSAPRMRDWRLPDAALWTLLAGLTVLVAPWPQAAPTGWTLVLGPGLAFFIQGTAVMVSSLLARGVPPVLIVLTSVFVFVMTLPFFVLTAAAVGLSDVWLDYRRLEPATDGE